MNENIYTRQNFLDTALRRVREARVLLDNPKKQKQRDGAVSLALLAAECALKAILMHGYQINTTEDANDIQRTRWFKGIKGHNLQILWSDLHASQKNLANDAQHTAISILNQADPYAYRYGKKKPIQQHAEPFVQHSEILIQWMRKITGIGI